MLESAHARGARVTPSGAGDSRDRLCNVLFINKKNELLQRRVIVKRSCHL